MSPDPAPQPTADPKWYKAEPFMLGADVPDGREGRRQPNLKWRSGEHCRREFPCTIHETRPVPERMVTLPPLPESVVRGWAEIGGSGAIGDACREAVEKLDGES
jgi:hypothetical protein